jgi:hypothetical protein
MRSDCILIVANISRALNDASLQTAIFESIQRLFPYEWGKRAGQSFHIAVICTKADVLIKSHFNNVSCLADHI